MHRRTVHGLVYRFPFFPDTDLSPFRGKTTEFAALPRRFLWTLADFLDRDVPLDGFEAAAAAASTSMADTKQG